MIFISKGEVKAMTTLISNNCYGVAYEKAKKVDYTTPFFSVFIFAQDYITFLESFDEYIAMTPRISKGNISRHYKYPRKYPVLLIGECDIEIHCAHDKKGAQDSVDKWCRRRDRMDLDKSKMIVKLCDRDKFRPKLGHRFLALDQFPNKRLFISHKWKEEITGDDVTLVPVSGTRCPIGTTLEKLHPVLN